MSYKLSLRIENGLFTHTFKAEIKKINELFASLTFWMNMTIGTMKFKMIKYIDH